MWHSERTTRQMLDAAREIGPEEARQIHAKANYKRYGLVAGLRTSPEKFREYMARRSAEDLRAKHGKR